jgi:hypothetical protein
LRLNVAGLQQSIKVLQHHRTHSWKRRADVLGISFRQTMPGTSSGIAGFEDH